MSDIKLKGYLYFAIEGVKGLPVLGSDADRVDSYVSVFLDDMEEAATETVYDEENPMFSKQLRIKVNGYYSTCSLQVLNAQPKQGQPENLGQVVLNLADITSDGEEKQHDEQLTLRPEAATGDPNIDKVSGSVKFVTKYKAYKKRATKAERDAALVKAKAEAEVERQKKLEQERIELEARLEAERKAQEKAEADRLAAAKALKEQAAREEAERQAAAAALAAKAERERREAEAKAELERRAFEDAQRAEQLRLAQEAERAANEARQRMLLEEQKKSTDAAAKQVAVRALAELDEGFDSEIAVDDNHILAPARGQLTTRIVSRQTAPSIMLTGNVSNVSGGKDGNLYVANKADRIYFLKHNGGWTQIPGAAICLAAAPDGTVLCANRYQRIYSLGPDHMVWTQMKGSMAWITAGSKKHIWGVDIEGHPHQYDADKDEWTKKPGHNFQRIAAGNDGEVWAVSKDQRAYRWNGQGWTIVPGSIKDVAVQNASGVWAVSTVGGIYQWHGNHWRKLPGGDKFHGITVTQHGAWSFDERGNVYHAPPPAQPALSDTKCESTLGSNGSFTPDKAVDGSLESFYWSQRAARGGDTFTVSLLTPIVRKTINVKTGKPKSVAGAKGVVEAGRVEISLDGITWISLGALVNGEFSGELPALPIRGARLFFTRPSAGVVAIQQFALFGIPARPATAGCKVRTNLKHHGDYAIEKAVDSDIGSFYWSGYSYPQKGDFVELTFEEPVQKQKIIVVTGHPDGRRDFVEEGSIHVTYDGSTWEKLQTFKRQAVVPLVANKPIRGLKLVNEQTAKCWVAIREILLA
mmetsp:Transcript_21327/g.36393  ORF Transcript_21327/g.36393 Transcript_21327/m.36393 type:complete len:809 (+) Transcript_21327:95-2521(+)